MTYTTLATPTLKLFDPTFSVVATNLPVAASQGSDISGTASGFKVPWVAGLAVVITGGAAGTGNVTLVGPSGTSAPNVVFALPATSQTVVYGPVPSEYADPTTLLVTFNVTTVTNARAGAFLMPNVTQDKVSTGSSHNPFENNPSATDF